MSELVSTVSFKKTLFGSIIFGPIESETFGDKEYYISVKDHGMSADALVFEGYPFVLKRVLFKAENLSILKTIGKFGFSGSYVFMWYVSKEDVILHAREIAKEVIEQYEETKAKAYHEKILKTEKKRKIKEALSWDGKL